MNMPTMTLEQIRIKGLEVLTNELGPVGMIRFLQQFETGKGDYSVERHNWLDGMDVQEIVEEIQRLRYEKENK